MCEMLTIRAARGVFAIYEPHQSELGISYLMTGERSTVLVAALTMRRSGLRCTACVEKMHRRSSPGCHLKIGLRLYLGFAVIVDRCPVVVSQ